MQGDFFNNNNIPHFEEIMAENNNNNNGGQSPNGGAGGSRLGNGNFPTPQRQQPQFYCPADVRATPLLPNAVAFVPGTGPGPRQQQMRTGGRDNNVGPLLAAEHFTLTQEEYFNLMQVS